MSVAPGPPWLIQRANLRLAAVPWRPVADDRQAEGSVYYRLVLQSMLHWESLRWPLKNRRISDWHWWCWRWLGSGRDNEGAEQHSKALCVLSHVLHGCVPACDCVLQVKYYLFPFLAVSLCPTSLCSLQQKGAIVQRANEGEGIKRIKHGFYLFILLGKQCVVKNRGIRSLVVCDKLKWQFKCSCNSLCSSKGCSLSCELLSILNPFWNMM